MSDAPAFAGCALAIGVGATAVMDAWALVRKRCFGVPPLDYALVGRWLGHLARARVRHAPIAACRACRASARSAGLRIT